MTDIDAIREVVRAHQFASTSSTRNGINTHYAGCTCDPALRFDWYERDAQHREHLHLAIFNAGRTATKDN